MEIKEMTVEDLEKIESNLEEEFDDFWNANILRSEIENLNTKYIVAKDNDRIVGFAGLLILPDTAEINNIVVKKENRKKGIGKLLLEKLIYIAKDMKKENISLEVNEKNVKAINLYEKYGFEKVGLRKKYYNGCDNAIIMTKNLLK